jgi:hypothetical protein
MDVNDDVLVGKDIEDPPTGKCGWHEKQQYIMKDYVYDSKSHHFKKPLELYSLEELKAQIELCHYDPSAIETYNTMVRNGNKTEADLFLAQETRYDHPVNTELCKGLEKGYLQMGTEQNGRYVQLIYGHLCDYLAPDIKRCIANDICTFNVTGKNFLLQDGYHCIQCYPDVPNHSICQSCANNCHSGHEMVKLPKVALSEDSPNLAKPHLFCDCFESGMCMCI